QQFNAGGLEVLVQALDLSSITPDNSPPVVTFTPPVVAGTIASPQSGFQFPLVCGLGFFCNITDSDGDAITDYLWQGSHGLHLARTDRVPSAFLVLPAGTYTFTLTARDERGALGFGTLTVNVSDKNTFVSTSPQTIALTDERFFGTRPPASITFDSVTSPGLS